MEKKREYLIKEIYDMDFDGDVLISGISEFSVNVLYNLYNNDTLDVDNNDIEHEIYSAIGIYYLYKTNHEQKGLLYLQKAVRVGDSSALIILGDYCMIKNQPDIALTYYEMAAKAKNYYAYLWLARYYRDTNINQKKMLYYYDLALKHNMIPAMNDLGHHYYNIKDYDKSYYYFDMSASLGNARALCNIGILYNDIFNDTKKAQEYLLKSIEKGDMEAKKVFLDISTPEEKKQLQIYE